MRRRHCTKRKVGMTVKVVAAGTTQIFYYPPPPIGERSIVMSVSVCVCPRSYLLNCTSDLHQMFFSRMLHTAVARSSSGGVVIRYLLPVLWMLS